MIDVSNMSAWVKAKADRLGFGMWGLLAALLAVTLPQAAQAQTQDKRYEFPQQYTLSPKGVNVQTGHFMASKTDLSVGNLSLTRHWGDTPTYAPSSRAFGVLSYSSEQPPQGWVPTNRGWGHNFIQGVEYWPGNNSSLPRIYVVVGGTTYTFVVLTDGTIGPADQSSQGTRLEGAAGSANQWLFTDRGGNQYLFFAHPAIAQGGIAGNPKQILQSVTYADGGRTDYSYNAAAQPKLVRSSTGYALVFDYNAQGNVASACGFNLAQTYVDTASSCAGAALKTSYGYDASGTNLTSVTDTLGRIVTISYNVPGSATALVACMSLPNSATCEIQNVYGLLPGEVVTIFDDQARIQTTATGDIWRYTYSSAEDSSDIPTTPGYPRYSGAQMIDAAGRNHGFRYDRGHMTRQTTPAGQINYRYAYRMVNVLYGAFTPTTLQYHDATPRLITHPEGNREYIGHDSRGNLTHRSYWPKGAPNPIAPSDPKLDGCCVSADMPVFPPGSITYTQSFLPDEGFTSFYGHVFILGCGSGPADAKRCSKPLSRTDPDGSVTDYDYDPAHGGILSETGPAVNGVRPQTRYTYAQRYAWVKDVSGGFVRAATPVWLLMSKSYCKAGAASGGACALPGDEVRTTYDYGPDAGPNNLLLRGVVEDAGGLNLRSCYTYDWRGNKLSETGARAGLAVCP